MTLHDEQQPELFLDDLRDPRILAFLEFHQANPGVYWLFVRFAREVKAAGRERFGGRLIAERIRWYTHVETNDLDFKYNNNWTPFYVRMIERDYPEFEGFFEKRSSIAEALSNRGGRRYRGAA